MFAQVRVKFSLVVSGIGTALGVEMDRVVPTWRVRACACVCVCVCVYVCVCGLHCCDISAQVWYFITVEPLLKGTPEMRIPLFTGHFTGPQGVHNRGVPLYICLLCSLG